MVAVETLVGMRVGGGRLFAPVALLSTVTFTTIAIVVLLRYVMNSRPINADKVFASVSAYVLIAVRSPRCSRSCRSTSRTLSTSIR